MTTLGDGLTRQERETLITFHESGDTVTIATASPVMARKLAKIAATYGVTVEHISAWQARATLPIRALSFRNNRQITEEERAQRIAALEQGNAVTKSRSGGVSSAQMRT